MNARGSHGRRSHKFVIWVVLAVGVLLIGYLAIWAPEHYARATGSVADGSEQFEVGGGVTVTPGEGWAVESKVEDFVGPFKSWSIFFSDPGVQLLSPDRALRVEVAGVPAGDPVELAATRSGAEVISETLASGAEVRHVDTGDRIVALVNGVGSEPVVLEARVRGGAALSDYRPALSSILESLKQGGESA